MQRLSYEDGRPNAEAMVVQDDVIWILDKQPGSPTGLYRSELSGDDPAQSSTLVRVSELDLGDEVVTAADLSPDGSVLAVRTNSELWLHPVEPGDDIRAALGNERCATPELDEAQGESVAVLPGLAGLVTVSEDESGGTVAMHLTAPGSTRRGPTSAVLGVGEVEAAAGVPSVRWLPWAGMPPASFSIRARCIRFHVMNVVLRLVKSFSGPPEPSSR